MFEGTTKMQSLCFLSLLGVTRCKELIKMVVYDTENRDGMLHLCEKFPSIDVLKIFLTTKFEEKDNNDVK